MLPWLELNIPVIILLMFCNSTHLPPQYASYESGWAMVKEYLMTLVTKVYWMGKSDKLLKLGRLRLLAVVIGRHGKQVEDCAKVPYYPHIHHKFAFLVTHSLWLYGLRISRVHCAHEKQAMIGSCSMQTKMDSWYKTKFITIWRLQNTFIYFIIKAPKLGQFY